MIPDKTSRCTLCDRLVLGLAGHDWTALPWMLAPGTGVQPGPCHVRCLEELGAAAAWSAAVEAYHRTRWPLWLSGVDGTVRWRLHGSRAARRFHLWRSDGRLTSFPYATATTDPMRISTDLAEIGTAHAATLLSAMATDEENRDVPLTYVLTALDLADRYPRTTGTVTRTTDGLLVARHRLRLDRDCRRAARQLSQSRR